jgi:hypothetical protein
LLLDAFLDNLELFPALALEILWSQIRSVVSMGIVLIAIIARQRLA